MSFGDSGAEVNCVSNKGNTRRIAADDDSFIDLATLPQIFIGDFWLNGAANREVHWHPSHIRLRIDLVYK